MRYLRLKQMSAYASWVIKQLYDLCHHGQTHENFVPRGIRTNSYITLIVEHSGRFNWISFNASCVVNLLCCLREQNSDTSARYRRNVLVGFPLWTHSSGPIIYNRSAVYARFICPNQVSGHRDYYAAGSVNVSQRFGQQICWTITWCLPGLHFIVFTLL
jgi:hypothetical protein